MHSRLIELNVEKRPEDEWATEDTIIYQYEWFLNETADYVNLIPADDEDDDDYDEDDDYVDERTESILWLLTYITDENTALERYTNGQVEITKTDIQAFFKTRYEEFKEELEKLNTTTLDDFCSTGILWDIYGIKSAVDEQCGFFIKCEDDICSLDQWLRYQLKDMISNNTESVSFFVESVFDYHC